MSGLGLDLAAVAQRRGGAPDWPEGAVALWLILGQSNAEGYAPYAQDPARTDPAAAAPALTPEERAAHPWLWMSTRGAGPEAGRFVTAQGVATEATPRTSGKVWMSGDHGIPVGAPCFGPEIGLVRHVLGGGAPGSWRDDAAPRLAILKQTEGGRSVDHFRWGGAGKDLVLNALRRDGGSGLASLAAAGPVLVQGIIFVIGEKDATDPRPGGGGMADTLAVRFAEWVRQLRAALGGDVPVLFTEIHDALDARKAAANAALAALAAALPNAAVLPRAPDWGEIGDGVHYDAAAQDAIGRAAFAHFRDAHGRPGDGLVTAHPFEGLRPWFHLAPVFVDDVADRMRIAATSAVDGTLHAVVLDAGAPAPSAEEIRDGAAAPGGLSRPVSADLQTVFYSDAGSFAANADQDMHYVLEGADGALGERGMTPRRGGARFAPDLAVDSVTVGGAVLSARPGFPGEISWALHVGPRDLPRPEDVEAAAFRPVRAGSRPVGANEDVVLDFSGLASGVEHVLFLTGRRTSDGARAMIQAASFMPL